MASLIPLIVGLVLKDGDGYIRFKFYPSVSNQ